MAAHGIEPIDLLISDIKMPDMSGVDVLRAAKQADPDVLGIMITAFASTETAVEAMRLGACDYLIKPFSPGELAARVRSVLRRSADTSSGGRSPFRPRGEGVEIDTDSRNVWVDGVLVELAAKEFELLAYFVDHPRRVCTRTEILAAVWASNAGWQTEATVTEHVYRLRQKIEPDPQRPRRLRTVRAVGYRWEG